MNAFAATLKVYRQRAGLSQSKLAEAADLDHSYASRLESGAREPSRDCANRLADALGLEDAERTHFLAVAGYTNGPPPPYDPEIEAANRLLTDPAIPEARKAWLRAFIGLAVEGVESEAAA